MEGKYYLGLDIGTNSVGWAVTNEKYELCKFNKKSMWGIRLFESGETAAERRVKRASRRRLQRRNQRIKLLQDLFNSQISKIDSTFFIRLNESKLYEEDKTVKIKHPIFPDNGYAEVDYYNQYPTIYHLRKELINNKQEHDIRLVYLAIHHILKSRGHFLIDGSLENAKDFKNTINQFILVVKDELDIDLYLNDEELQECENILKNKNFAKSTKAKMLAKLFNLSQEDKTPEEIKLEKTALTEICKLMVGNKGDVKKIFMVELEGVDKTSFKFSDIDYDDIKSTLESLVPDKAFVLDHIKALYDWSVLVEILDNENYISFAKVKQYEKHKNNLSILRRFIIKYCDKSVYKDFFNNEKSTCNYANYVGSMKKNGKKYYVKKCKEEDFYKELGKILNKMKVDQDDIKQYQYLVNETVNMSLLPLQRSKDNGVVPNQVHKIELYQILNNASNYLPFLKEKDESGFTVSDKIMQIFSFRIPYYVGPLSNRHTAEGANAWVVRKEEGRIYPWNFKDKVDEEKSNEAFIQRMTNKCTYLPMEYVVPKQSLMYSKFMVLNELNNLKIRGRSITVSQKQSIYKELFLKKTKVTGKILLDYLKKEDEQLQICDLSGFDKDFKASMSSYLDFEKKVFGHRILEDKVKEIVEDCIKWLTIYGDDKNMLKKVIDSKYSKILTKEEIKNICKLRYSGWGNLSEMFLKGVKGREEIDKETGESFTILNGLWNTNHNLMQLLSKKFTFKSEIDKINAEVLGEITEISYDALIKDLYVSPANKRAIWQTIQITEEIKKIMGCVPDKIFVEMARGEEEGKDRRDKNNNRKNSRKQKLIDLYSSCKEDVKKWTEEISSKDERDFNSMKLFLYYTQMGRCMYTGEPIDLDELMSSNLKWDRDHIYPQSKIKDDSIDNLVLVKKEINAKKDNEMLSFDIQQKMRPFWKQLYENNFISKKKFDRLNRRDEFTTDELAGFINRQLVETRQSSKAVAELLDRMYMDTEIVYVKAALVSNFRKTPLNMLKSRRINDFHHAKDAYLNIVVGNVFNSKFTSNPLNWIKENNDKNYSINKVFYYDVFKGDNCVWKAPSQKGDEKISRTRNSDGEYCAGSIDTVRKVMEKNDICYTEYTYCEKGKLFDENSVRKTEDIKIMRLKKDLDPAKYGGYKTANTSYFAQVEFDGKKEGERVKNIIGVPVYISNMLEHNENAFLEYCQNIKKMKNIKILKNKIKKNTLLVIDGFPMRIRGENDKNTLLKGNMQLILDKKNTETVRLIEKYLEKGGTSCISEKYDKLSKENMVLLYDALCKKLEGPLYCSRPANMLETLKSGREIFLSLSDTVCAKVLNEILSMLRCDSESKSNLLDIGGKANSGKISINKNTIGKMKVTLINQSVTGLFVNKEIL